MANSPFSALWIEETAESTFEMSIVERSIEDLPDGEVLIEVEYSSLNFKDALSAHGNRAVTRAYPHTPGIDAAGVVVSDSSGHFSVGTQVIVTGYDLGMNTPGGLAGYIRVPANWVVPMPKELTAATAMAYGTAGLTAALCILKLLAAGAKPSDGEVLVTGATGGVGSLAVAMLSQLGFDVCAATGKLDSTDFLTQIGAKKVIDRDTLIENIKKPMLKPLWAHGIDTLGGEHLFSLVKSLHHSGSVAACGLVAGVDFAGNVFPFILRGVNLLGVDSVEISLAEKHKAWQHIASDFAIPSLAQLVTEISLKQVPQYMGQMINGHAMGRYRVKIA